jgi:Uncharacterized conserved protein
VPFVIFGVNAITVYFVSGMVAKLMGLWKITRMNGKPGTLHSYIYDHLFAGWLTQINASLAYALFFNLVMLFLMWLLYRKKIFIKI